MDVSEPCQNNKTNCLHKRTPRIIHNDETSFKQLLEKDGSASIYTKNFLAVEMFKVVEENKTIISCGKNYFLKVPRNKTVRNGFQSISHLGPKC